MSKKYLRFAAVKLILIAFAELAAMMTAFFLSKTVTETTDPAFASALGFISTIVFFAFTYSFESKIRVPREKTLDAKYFASFALRESSVYAIFLVPLTFLAYAFSIDTASGKFVSSIFRPHLLLSEFGVPAYVSAIVMFAVYFAVAYIAHLRASKKPEPPETADVLPAFEEYASDEEDEYAEDEDNEIDDDGTDEEFDDTDADVGDIDGEDGKGNDEDGEDAE